MLQTDEEQVDSWLNLEDDLQEEVELQEEVQPAADSGDGGSERHRRKRDYITDYPGFNCISVDKALRLHFSRDKKLAGERIRRVRSAARAGTKQLAEDDDTQELEGELVAKIDPVRVLVQTAVGVSYVVAVCMSFDVLRGGTVVKDVDSVTVSEAQQPSTVVRCQVLRPQLVEGEESKVLLYSSESFCENMTVPGCYVRPINPQVCTVEEGGSCQWQLQVYSLTVLMELHHLELDAEQRKKLPELKDARSIVRNNTGSAIFVVDGTEAEAAPGELSQPKKSINVEVRCELCGMSCKADRMRQHMGAHILCEESWEKYLPKSGVTKPAFPCGLCGVRSSIGQIMIDPKQALGCPCAVTGTKAHPKPKHQCKLVGDDIKYTLGSAAKCSLSAPCTNRPIKCTVCSMAVWSYSTVQHFETKHASMPMCTLAPNPRARGPLLTHYLLTSCMVSWLVQARGAHQANQAPLPREGACATAAEGAHMQGRLQGPQVRVQELLIVNVCERIEAEATSLSFMCCLTARCGALQKPGIVPLINTPLAKIFAAGAPPGGGLAGHRCRQLSPVGPLALQQIIHKADTSPILRHRSKAVTQ